MITDQELKILRDYATGADFAAMAKSHRTRVDVISGIAARLGYNRQAAAELLRQHARGASVSLPTEVRHAAAQTTRTAPAPAAPARAAAADRAPAVETPRRSDADEEVAAEDPGDGAAATALDDIAELVRRALDHAYFIAPRWHCSTCRLWPLDPGACAQCGGPLQPVFLATLPREVHP